MYFDVALHSSLAGESHSAGYRLGASFLRKRFAFGAAEFGKILSAGYNGNSAGRTAAFAAAGCRPVVAARISSPHYSVVCFSIYTYA